MTKANVQIYPHERIRNLLYKAAYSSLLAERRAPEFEPLMGCEEVEIEKKMVDGKNKKIQNNKTTTKEKSELVKRFSNHIEFKDYIPTHEVITYRHLFAYGFYVE